MKIKTLKTVFEKFLTKIKNGKLELKTEDEEDVKDYIAKYMGPFGVYQLIVCGIVSLSRFPAMWNLLSSLLVTPKTDFICKNLKENASEDVKNSTCYNDCVKYEYYQEVFQDTVISKFELICDRSWQAYLAQIVLMFGALVGTWLFGWISDRQGRRVSLRLATFFNIIFLLLACFSINYWMFIIIRFILGITSGAILVISTVYALEVVGSNHKEIAVCWILLGDGIAGAMMTIFVYCSSTWDTFILEYLAVSVLMFILVLVLPDTPRWYVSQGKVERAIEVAMKAAICNNRNINHIEENMKAYMEKLNVLFERPKKMNMQLLYQKETMKYTFCMIVMFGQVGIGLYSTYKHINMLLPNVYISLILIGIIQISASLLSIALNKVFERRIVIMGILVVNMVAIPIFYLFHKDSWVSIFTLAIIHGSIIINLAVINILTAELYPTAIRSTALGVSSSGLILGALVTSFIMHLELAWAVTLYLVVYPLLAIGFCILLPETKGCHLKDNFTHSSVDAHLASANHFMK